MAFYLVTGGAGFIGSHLTDALLAGGHRVRVLDDLSTGKRENLPAAIDLIVGDVANPATVSATLTGTDGCFHLAAIASVQRGNEDWLGTNRVNLGGTLAVLDAAQKLGRLPVVYASSAAIYGDVGAAIAHEGLTPAPRTAYGADKRAGELHASAGFLVHGVPSVGLRFFNVYGPRQDPASPYSGVISIFADRIARGLNIDLHGGGSQTRDFVFVADVVAHVLAAMPLAASGTGAHVANVCTGRETSIAALADIIAGITGKTALLTHGPARSGDIRRSLGDASFANSLLRVTADTTLPAGLSRTLAGAG